MATGKLGLALSTREIMGLVEGDLARVEEEFRLESVGSVDAVSQIAQYLQSNGGKRLRPILLLVSCRLFRDPSPAAIRLAAIVELIHTATLVHDDVIDDARTRRGQPSANVRWGNQTSVLAGDWLYMQAFQIALRLRSFEILDLLISLTQRMVDEGMFLNSRFSMGGQSAALQLQELRVVAAIVAVPEARVADLRKGQPARLFITGQPEPLPSEVYIINDFIDPKARTVEVRLPVRNPGYAINSGVSVVAEIITDPVEAIIVPRRALRGDGANVHLFVLAGDTVRRRAVKTVDVDLDRVRILEGVAAVVQVVLDPPATLADGAKVRVRATDARPGPAAGSAPGAR